MKYCVLVFFVFQFACSQQEKYSVQLQTVKRMLEYIERLDTTAAFHTLRNVPTDYNQFRSSQVAEFVYAHMLLKDSRFGELQDYTLEEHPENSIALITISVPLRNPIGDRVADIDFFFAKHLEESKLSHIMVKRLMLSQL